MYSNRVKIDLDSVSDGKVLTERRFYEVVEACTEMLEYNEVSDKLMVELMYNRAMAQSKIGNIRDAISDCVKALKVKTDHVSLLTLRAECHEHVEDFKKSIEDYEMILCIESVNMNVVQYVHIASKIESLKTVGKHREAEQHISTADQHYEEKNDKLALAFYDLAINLWPENVSIYNRKIQCFIVLGDVSGAEKTIQKCTEIGMQRDIIDAHERQPHELKLSIEKGKSKYKKRSYGLARKLSSRTKYLRFMQ